MLKSKVSMLSQISNFFILFNFALGHDNPETLYALDEVKLRNKFQQVALLNRRQSKLDLNQMKFISIKVNSVSNSTMLEIVQKICYFHSINEKS